MFIHGGHRLSPHASAKLEEEINKSVGCKRVCYNASSSSSSSSSPSSSSSSSSSPLTVNGLSLREEWTKDALWPSYRLMAKKKALLLLCFYTYFFLYLYVHLRTKLRIFSCPNSVWPYESFFGHRFVAVLAYNQKCVRFWNYNNEKNGSRLHDDNAVIVGPTLTS